MVDALHHLGVDVQRLKPIHGIEPGVPKMDTENVATAVVEVHFQKDRPDIIDSGAQASASHDDIFGGTEI